MSSRRPLVLAGFAVALLALGLFAWIRNAVRSAPSDSTDAEVAEADPRAGARRGWFRWTGGDADAQRGDDPTEPTGVRHGRVIDVYTREGIPGALVRLQAWNVGAPGVRGPVETFVADAEGNFAIPAWPVCTIAATAPGYAVHWRGCDELTIALKRGIRVEGTVRDLVSRAPVAGARVECGYAADDGLDPAVTIDTDERGRYELDSCESDTLRVLHPSYAEYHQFLGAPEGAHVTHDAELAPGLFASGVVVREDGEPVSGAVIGAFNRYAYSPDAVAYTGPDGDFEIGPLGDGAWFLVATEPYPEAAAQTLVELPEQTEPVRLVLGSGRDVRIDVRVGSQAIAGAEVDVRTGFGPGNWRGELAGELGLSSKHRHGKTDEHGSFAVAGLGRFTYRVSVVSPRGRAEVELPPQVTELEVQLDAAGQVVAIVRDPSGRVREDVAVFASNRCPDPPSQYCSRSWYSPRVVGTQELFTLVPGEYEVQVRKSKKCPSTRPVPVTVVADRITDVDIPCVGGSRVRGRLVWAGSRRPAHGVKVRSTLPGVRDLSYDPIETFTNENGEFELEPVGSQASLSVSIQVPPANTSVTLDPEIQTLPGPEDFSLAGYEDIGDERIVVLQHVVSPRPGEDLHLGTLEIPVRTPPPEQGSTSSDWGGSWGWDDNGR